MNNANVIFQDDEEGGGGVGGPVFDQKSPANVTAVKGKVAQLSCKVLGLGNRTVRIHSFSFFQEYEKSLNFSESLISQ